MTHAPWVCAACTLRVACDIRCLGGASRGLPGRVRFLEQNVHLLCKCAVNTPATRVPAGAINMVAPFLLDLLGQFIRAGSVYTNVYKTSMYVCKRLYAHKSVYMRPSLNLPFDSYRVY